MAERKSINKYIPPTFDPKKVPHKVTRNAPHVVRIMAPYSMRCNTCGEYIYKGRKFNARKEKVREEDYLGIEIFRFYIRCPLCGSEITYKTDPKNADYAAEHGATRNFEPWRTELAEKEQSQNRRRMEELYNPMKALEHQTYDSKREIEVFEGLDVIRTANKRLEDVDADLLYERVAQEAELERQGKILNVELEEDEEVIVEKYFKAPKVEPKDDEAQIQDLIRSTQTQSIFKKRPPVKDRPNSTPLVRRK